MTLLRLVLSDLHLGTGTRRGQLNPLEDFIHDDRLVELLAYYDQTVGADGSIELILNGDIFDLLKVKIAGEWPTEVTEEIAVAKLQQCLEGHPKFVLALREFLQKPTNRVTYLPGNHDLELWFSDVQVAVGIVFLGSPQFRKIYSDMSAFWFSHAGTEGVLGGSSPSALFADTAVMPKFLCPSPSKICLVVQGQWLVPPISKHIISSVSFFL